MNTRLIRIKPSSLEKLNEMYPNIKHNSKKIDKLLDCADEYKEVKNKIYNMGERIYGKYVWKRAYKKNELEI